MTETEMTAPPEIHRREDGLPTIGLAMIVKDEAETLPRLLDSIGWTEQEFDPRNANPKTLEELGATRARPDGGRNDGFWRTEPAVDFVVICDTGSSDETVEIAGRRGCRVVDFEWVENFSKARQASYEALPEDLDFTLWADGDDVLKDAHRLRELGRNLPPTVAGTIHRYNYAQDEVGNCVCELWRERLVRRHVDARWDLPIHEVLKVEGQLVHVQEVEWIHATPPDRERDAERNHRILQTDYDEAIAAGRDPSPRTVAYLGTESLALGRPEEAEALFREYLDRADATWDQERCQVAHKLSIALRVPREGEQGVPAERLEASAQAAYRAIEERPDWADGYVDLAEIALQRDQAERALKFCETAQKLDPPQTLLIINPLEYGYQPELMKAIALTKLGRTEEAWESTQRCLQITPQRQDLLAQSAGLQATLQTGTAERLVLELRELLVRFDENAKARTLLDECVPYIAVNTNAIAQARLDQREMTLHSTDPDVYSSYYRDNPNEARFEEQGIPIPKAHETFHRVAFLRRGLAKQAAELGRPLRVLDLSCNDGWMLENLKSSDLEFERLDGMDLNRGAAECAQKRLDPGASGKTVEEADAKRYPARIVRDDLHAAPEHFDVSSYDAVVCFETIEHVPDVERTLDVMGEMASPEGRLYISTPDGAFERGNIPDWFRVESKGHLRALRAADVAALVAPRGIVHDFEVAQRLAVAAVSNEPRRGKVVLYAGAVDAAPEKIIEEGLGGSETALCKMAELLARRGWDVRVYAGNETALRGDHVSVGEERHDGGNVLYLPPAAWDPGEPCDLFVSSRMPEVFDRTIAARRRALWLHDASYGDRLTAERASRATDILVLSEYQRDLLTGAYPFLAEHPNLQITRNGIETSFFEKLRPLAKRKPWAIFSSSPDRGLDVLLELWPAIRKQVPDAELHHTYAPVYHRFRETQPHLARFHERILELEAEAEGVVSHTALGQRELAELYSKARCWAYPSWTSKLPDGGSAPFPEISCITAVEAQAAGVIPVALEYGALVESVVTGALLPELGSGPEGRTSLSAEWREDFVEAVVRALTDDAWFEACLEEGRPWALERDWAGVVDQWEAELLPSSKPSEPVAA